MALSPDRRAFTGLFVAALVCALTFAALAELVLVHAPTTGLDRSVQAFALAHRTPWLNAVLEASTWLGSSTVLIPVLLAASAYLGWTRRDPSGVILLWVALAGAAALYQLFKSVIGRPRPPSAQMLTHAGGYAYPSGHSTQAIVIWGLLAAFAVNGPRRRRTRWAILGAAAVVILLVGASRIYLGVHWITDVAGGYALGGAWLALLLAVRALR
jgi:undecaprenyl-diphosphatase